MVQKCGIKIGDVISLGCDTKLGLLLRSNIMEHIGSQRNVKKNRWNTSEPKNGTSYTWAQIDVAVHCVELVQWCRFVRGASLADLEKWCLAFAVELTVI